MTARRLSVDSSTSTSWSSSGSRLRSASPNDPPNANAGPGEVVHVSWMVSKGAPMLAARQVVQLSGSAAISVWHSAIAQGPTCWVGSAAQAEATHVESAVRSAGVHDGPPGSVLGCGAGMMVLGHLPLVASTSALTSAAVNTSWTHATSSG